MAVEFDVIVIGSGPAGVASAFPLVESGFRVLLVDGGREMTLAPPAEPFLEWRTRDASQWERMVGRDFHALRNTNAVSPKLRVPMYGPVFDGFHTANQVVAEDFVALGSLAKGGLSAAWGCGVARLSPEELRHYPFPASELDESWAVVTGRMGVSGAGDDDLSEYFGLDAWSDPALPLDPLHARIWERYLRRGGDRSGAEFRLGRSRVAALSVDRGARKACSLSGNCLWGCSGRSLYSSADDLASLEARPGFSYRAGFVAEEIGVAAEGIRVRGRDASGSGEVRGRKVILAAGTLATTRLALRALRLPGPVRMHSCPTAAFILWLPGATGSGRAQGFGLGQLSFVQTIEEGMSAFGSLFGCTGIPVSEFARYIPLTQRYGIDLLRGLLGSCVIGNAFLPGHLSNATLTLQPDGGLRIVGGYRDEVPLLMKRVQRRLRAAFWNNGAVLLPGSFTVGRPGGDIHYAASLPMRANPERGETNAAGELHGLPGVYVADGASLSALSEKSHTLTIMANADRIGRRLCAELKAGY